MKLALRLLALTLAGTVPAGAVLTKDYGLAHGFILVPGQAASSATPIVPVHLYLLLSGGGFALLSDGGKIIIQ